MYLLGFTISFLSLRSTQHFNLDALLVWAQDIYQNSDWIERAIANIATNKVFITIDLDGLNPSLMPGVGTPEPGGLDWYQLIKFLKTVFTKFQVIGCDVMELAPTCDSVVSQFIAAKLVYKLAGYYHFSLKNN